MGAVSTVISALKAAGIRAEAAYPGRRMPHITGPVAAVMLEKNDYTNKTSYVSVTVWSPSAQGGAACEQAAENAAQAAAGVVLAGMDTGCIQETCQFDSNADCYYVPIRLIFSPTPEQEPELVPVPEFSAMQDSTVLSGAVGFKAWRQADTDAGTALSDAVWQIQLEEEFAVGEAEQVVTSEPFQLTITRDTSVEVYGSCTWMAVEREDDLTCLRQIRKGTAGSRSYTAK